MRPDANLPINGDCESCTRTNVAITRVHNNMMMCDECIAKESALVTVNHTVAESRQIDDVIEIKPDMFNATTVAFVELQAAIQHDPSIAEDMKGYALVEEAARRIKVMNAAILADKAALLAKENERYAWLTQTQNVASKLRADLREKFKQFDLSYEPKPQKTPKSKPVKTATNTSKAEVRKAVNDAASKYNVDASIIKMMLLSRPGLTPETAAIELAKLTGKA